jgi:DNA-binding PadR family transcriptional regulator
MNNTPQKPKRIDTRKNRKKPVSQGRKTLKQLGIQDTPLTNPSRYIKYGTLSHKVLSYAQFRRSHDFSATDYQEFLFKKQDSGRLNQVLGYLTNLGYLIKSDHPNPPDSRTKHIYAVTMSGSHALLFVGRRNREREEAKMRKTLRDNGVLGWETRLKNQNL